MTRQDRFEALFAADPDPWNFETSEYERDKRTETLSMLGDRLFESGLEIGCATGVLTQELATVCKRIVGIDIAEPALQIARKRLKRRGNVDFQQGNIPRNWPEGAFDLIVLSEVLYFLDEREIVEVSSIAHGTLSRDGACLLVNWTGPNDLPLDGNSVVEIFGKAANWRPVRQVCYPQYRLDRFEIP